MDKWYGAIKHLTCVKRVLIIPIIITFFQVLTYLHYRLQFPEKLYFRKHGFSYARWPALPQKRKINVCVRSAAFSLGAIKRGELQQCVVAGGGLLLAFVVFNSSVHIFFFFFWRLKHYRKTVFKTETYYMCMYVCVYVCVRRWSVYSAFKPFQNNSIIFMQTARKRNNSTTGKCAFLLFAFEFFKLKFFKTVFT